jgi:hypothetical protein
VQKGKEETMQRKTTSSSGVRKLLKRNNLEGDIPFFRG